MPWNIAKITIVNNIYFSNTFKIFQVSLYIPRSSHVDLIKLRVFNMLMPLQQKLMYMMLSALATRYIYNYSELDFLVERI
jgi:hypothetical protein